MELIASGEQLDKPAGQKTDPAILANSFILLGGVGLSAATIAMGVALLAVTGRTGYHNALGMGLLRARQGGVTFPKSFGRILNGVDATRPFAIIQMGLLMLIATPVLRVAASVILFLARKDYLYACVALLVTMILVVSIFWIT